MNIQPSNNAARQPSTRIPPTAATPDIPRVAGDRLVRSRTDRPLSAADKQLLDEITAAHLRYFTQQSHPVTGLTRDRSSAGSAASIAAVGFSLTAHGIAVERGLMSREEAARYSLDVLRTLANTPEASHKGFFYHFLDPATARRAGKSEVSTVDTALMLAGVLFARNYFDGDGAAEREIRQLATQLYNQVDWNWALAGGKTLSLGWTPEPQRLRFPLEQLRQLANFFGFFRTSEPGFIPFRWSGYSEGMLMVLLGLGSPTHPLPADAWQRYHRADKTAKVGNQPYVPFGPMFGHQYSHAWIDFTGIQDAASRQRGFDWSENSRRAVLAQHRYAVENPKGFKGYGPLDWGLTASDGPGKAAGRGFHGYLARGVNGAPDDGTLAPTAAAASLPFAPELVLPTLHHWRQEHPELWGPEGFADAYNPTAGWVAQDRLGIDQGPIVLMTENFRSGFVWEVMKKDPDLRRGLQRAGFSGGWLDQGPSA